MDKLMEPSSTLQWVDRTLVKPNDYNPNKRQSLPQRALHHPPLPCRY